MARAAPTKATAHSRCEMTLRDAEVSTGTVEYHTTPGGPPLVASVENRDPAHVELTLAGGAAVFKVRLNADEAEWLVSAIRATFGVARV